MTNLILPFQLKLKARPHLNVQQDIVWDKFQVVPLDLVKPLTLKIGSGPKMGTLVSMASNAFWCSIFATAIYNQMPSGTKSPEAEYRIEALWLP